ncbi:hypothetical protein [Burkholderia puraquae]|uniref:hypothetical protein n=1 Tax=Burkholderia puraquae TaxID=1904757 RepID=UPI001055C33F|nr:hypothetical protein [Burkholderia puraquae]
MSTDDANARTVCSHPVCACIRAASFPGECDPLSSSKLLQQAAIPLSPEKLPPQTGNRYQRNRKRLQFRNELFPPGTVHRYFLSDYQDRHNLLQNKLKVSIYL